MLIFGGSWGSTLALCYGVAYPQNYIYYWFYFAWNLYGQCREINWFLYDMGRFILKPQEFVDYLPLADQDDDILDALLQTDDRSV